MVQYNTRIIVFITFRSHFSLCFNFGWSWKQTWFSGSHNDISGIFYISRFVSFLSFQASNLICTICNTNNDMSFVALLCLLSIRTCLWYIVSSNSIRTCLWYIVSSNSIRTCLWYNVSSNSIRTCLWYILSYTDIRVDMWQHAWLYGISFTFKTLAQTPHLKVTSLWNLKQLWPVMDVQNTNRNLSMQ